ncbi:echinoderm microtubule-associated protein-like CG42247 isoform X2 [Ruditapes philippinarum]|uniref:echinoderm microtubule-associated protein-like CG42247 isoform X2 n=1 Tax=Ruditapes philippinarum TaxID=129788 RepID=UPI00295A838B|nr:echinoderm microtubule-associated protein-like CG42247 isoform X2 [Ruditapes philippinarum]
MAKLKSKIPVRRPYSDERSKPTRGFPDQSDLRRISSDLSKPKNRHPEADENSVHSLDISSKNLRVRRFTVTIKDSKGEFVKRRKSYKLTYNQENDGGDEYEIEKKSVSDTSAKEFNDTHDVVDDLSHNESANYIFDDTVSIISDRSKKDDPIPNVTVADNFETYESEKSQTVFTDDTSIPIFDDESSESNAAFGDKFARDSSVPSQIYSPVSGTTIRLLTPQDRNERNILFQDRPFRKIAKVSKAGTFVSSEKKVLDDEKASTLTTVNDTEAETASMSKEDTSTSLPPKNFKANLFNRIRMISTPRRTPKFSPILHSSNTGKLSSTNQRLVSNGTENTFVKDSVPVRLKPIATHDIAKMHHGNQNNGVKSDQVADKDAEERYELIDLDESRLTFKPKRHRRSVDTSKTKGQPVQDSNLPVRIERQINAQTNQSAGLVTQSAILNKPVLKQSPKTSLLRSQGNPLLKSNRVLESSNNDIFSEADKRSRLRQAQYINDDLRIVKTKLQDDDFVALHIDSKLRETIQKKNVLNHLNKTPVVKESEMPPFPKKPLLAKPLVPKYTNKMFMTPNPKPADIDISNKVLGNQNSLAEVQTNRNSRFLDTSASTDLRKDLTHKRNIWQVQPKIHRFNSNKVREIGNKQDGNTVTKHSNATSNVAAWLLHSAGGANRANSRRKSQQTGKASFQIRRRVLNRKWKFMHRQDKQRKQRQERELKENKSTEVQPVEEVNLINLGMYMPLGIKKLKRKPIRLKPRLYTQVGKVKGYESEIPVLEYDSDVDVEEQMYDGPRPLTDTARDFHNYRRFEGEYDKVRPNYRNPAHQKGSNGCLVKFFLNGKSQHKGHIISINNKMKSFQTLLDDLTKKFGVRIDHVYNWPHGKEITDLSQFHNRCVYVVSPAAKKKKGNVLIPVTYGASKENYWSNRKMSGGRRRQENELYRKDQEFKESPVRNMPMVISVSYKSAPERKPEKFILNPQTAQEFEDWLEDLSKPNLPVRALYSDKPPYAQMKSYTHIFREHHTNSGFIACAEEMKPSELKKRQAPSSNSSSDSIGDSKNRKQKLQKQQDMGQIYENGSRDSSISTAMSRFDNGQQRSQSRVRGRRKDSRPRDAGSDNYVQVEVDGIPREFYPPTTKNSKDDGAKPPGMLKCEWVYGFRGRDTRHNLQVLPDTGELVYFVGAIVVLYNKETDTQRHYLKHTEDVSCITIHPDGSTVASGQMHGKKPENWAHIQIWDGETLNTRYVIGLGVLTGNVISIDFSKDASSKYICALDSSSKHLLSVWDWKNDRVVARTTTTLESVHCASFYPDGANNSILITYGVRHIYFWKIFFDAARKSDAKIFRDRQSGIFEKDIPNSINCIAFLKSGDVVTGDTSGILMIWCREAKDVFRCRKEISACDEPITAIVYMEEDDKLLVASGNEIKALDVKNGYTLIDKKKDKKEIPQGAGDIMTLVPQAPRGAGGRVYVGTTNDAIFEGSMKQKFRCIVQSHYDGYCCVAPHKIEPTFFSAGFDQVVYKWGMINHKVIWGTHIEHPCTALATLSKNMKTFDIVAVGTVIGAIYILHAYNGMNLTTVTVGMDPIGCLSFSDDESRIAVGCNDGSISVYEIPDRKTFIKAKVSSMCHSDAVASLDWSTDGRCIQSSSESNELMFWNTDTMDPVESPSSVRNIDWSTMNCPLSYGYVGPWSNMGKREVIKVANRSPNRKYCIMGDSCGRIRLYKYPCTKENAEFKGVRIYGSDVMALAFTADDNSLVSCGGADAGLVQWEITDD